VSPSAGPTASSPTQSPSLSPTVSPSEEPTSSPSGGRTYIPSASPTGSPVPSEGPTPSPSNIQSEFPSSSSWPSGPPSFFIPAREYNVSAEPSDRPSYIPSTSPTYASSQPTLIPTGDGERAPSESPSSLPTESLSPSASCPYEPILLSPDQSVEFATPPITILSRDNETVTFEVSQTITDGTLCLVGTYYESPTTNRLVCPIKESASPGVLGTYTAVCDNGKANVALYIFDEIFSTSSTDNVPTECYPVASGERTIKYDFIVPCSLSYDCPPPQTLMCEDVLPYISKEDFELAGQLQNWVFAVEGEDVNGNHFILLSENHPETFRTFDVPRDAFSVKFEIELFEQSGWSGTDLFYLRINDNYLDIGPFDIETNDHGNITGYYYNDVHASVEGLGPGRRKVALVIPMTWYTSGRLTLGMQIITSAAIVGIDKVELSPECTPLLYPSDSPSERQSESPSAYPNDQPSAGPHGEPTSSPSVTPSDLLSTGPTLYPSATPSDVPSALPSAVYSAGPSSGPTPSPSGNPTFVLPSSNPSSLPTARPTGDDERAPSESPSSLPTESLPPTESCPTEAILIDSEGLVDFASPPIAILSRDNETVTFEVRQTFTDGTLCLVGTYFESPTNNRSVCPVEDSVAPGVIGTHTAICHAGEAHVEVFIYDAMFSSSANANVPDECYPIKLGENTIKLVFILPCATWDWCPSVDNLKCTDIQPYIAQGEFESTEETATWIFAGEGEGSSGNHFLLLDGGHSETFSTFDIPTDGASVEVEFELYEQNGWSVDDMFYLRINDNYLDLGPFDSVAVEASSNDYFNDIYVATQGLSASRSKVFLTIPSTWFGDYGRLTLGMRIILSTPSASVGIDKFKLSATCGVSSVSAAASASTSASTTPSCTEGGMGDIMSTHFEHGLPDTATWTNALISEWDSWLNGGTTYGGKFLGRIATADNLEIGMDIAVDSNPITTPYIQLEFDVYTIDYVQPAYRLELKVRVDNVHEYATSTIYLWQCLRWMNHVHTYFLHLLCFLGFPNTNCRWVIRTYGLVTCFKVQLKEKLSFQ
jgi:hypothetical protein